MLTRRDVLTGIAKAPLALVAQDDPIETRLKKLEDNQMAIAGVIGNVIGTLGQIANAQLAIIEGCIVLEKRIVQLEARMFPDLEQGDDMHG